MSPNGEITSKAYALLGGNWGIFIVLELIFTILISLLTATCIGFLFIPPIVVGMRSIYLNYLRYGSEVKIADMFTCFADGKIINPIVVGLLKDIIVTAGLALLIVPGIYFACRYALVYYIMADREDIEISEAFKLSAEMMEGRKWKYFCLSCRFIGWGILSVITLGIGFLFLSPYMETAYAIFYEEVRQDVASRKAGEAFITE